MKIIRSTTDMQAQMRELRRSCALRLGFVPTMGYLHEGHATLMREVRRRGYFLVVSLFVNPLQFGPTEDLSRYPRDFERDRAMCEREGVDILFCPSDEAMYPAGEAMIVVDESEMSRQLCGRSRPGHFRGVMTVVAKLFHIVQPDLAIFGQKDAQQVLMIQAMVRALNFPLEIAVAPTVREKDGLAMSSRNRYLSPTERKQAVCLIAGLRAAQRRFVEGERSAAALRRAVTDVVTRPELAQLEYAEVVDGRTLKPLTVVTVPALLAVAARIGSTRLIDNLILAEGGTSGP